MRLENCSPEQLKREIKEAIGRHLDLRKYKLFVFGSRVSGKGDEHSDIDVGIEGQDEISFENMSKIKEELENFPTLYKIEVTDFSKTSQEFKDVALQHIEEIT